MSHIKPTDSHLVSKLKSVVGHISGSIEGHYPSEPFFSTKPQRMKEDLRYFRRQIVRTGEELTAKYSPEQIEAFKILGYLK